MKKETNLQKEVKKFNQKHDEFSKISNKEMREHLLKVNEDHNKKYSRQQEFFKRGLIEKLNTEKSEELLHDLKVILCEYFNKDKSSREVRDLYSLTSPVNTVSDHFKDIFVRYFNHDHSEFKRLNFEEYKKISDEEDRPKK